ncbi:hypothetical protein [Alcanivorax sp. DP30]|nr:hypothetical protein [Alcanivorax sp. DP30]
MKKMEPQYRLSLFAERMLRQALIIIPIALLAAGVAVIVAG